MRSINHAVISGVILLACTVILACSDSNGNSVASPAPSYEATIGGDSNPGHKLWGVWGVQFNTEEMDVAFEPLRNSQAHFDITDMLIPPACDDCITSVVNSFDPVSRIMDIDITLRNPYLISGYDVRGILHTNEYGHEILNADDWTNLFDVPGGLPLNPFKTFAKVEPQRMFAGSAEHTEKYFVHIPFPPNNEYVTFAVDASWPKNCEEPYEITYFWQEEITDTAGSSGYIYVSVFDWQGDVSKVTLVAPEITGEQFTQFGPWSGDIWCLELVNTSGVSAGDYKSRIIASSAGSAGLALYDYVTIHISPEPGIPDNPVDITPSGLDFPHTLSVAVSGEYCYVGKDDDDLAVINISTPESAYVFSETYISYYGAPDDFAIANGYLYFVGGFRIYDISSPGYPILVQKLSSPGYIEGFNSVDVSRGYACVASTKYDPVDPEYYWDGKFYVIDIDPPASADFVAEINFGGWKVGNEVVISDGYAYVACKGSYVTIEPALRIIDIDPPESSHVVKVITVPRFLYGVAVSDGYAFVVNDIKQLQIIDIDPVDNAGIVNAVTVPGYARRVRISAGYAYIANGEEGLQIIDVDPVESAYILSSIDTPGFAADVAIYDGYAYVADYDGGLRIIKLW